MPRSNEEFFSHTIRRLLEKDGVARVFVAESKERLTANVRGLPHTMPVPRIAVCLKGRAHYEFSCGGSLQTWEMHPGDAIFVPADCWMRVCADSDYDSLGVVFFHDLTRIIHAHSTVQVRRHPRYPFNLNRRVLIWPHPLVMVGRSLANQFLSTLSHPNESLRNRALMNLILYSILDTLREDPVEFDGGKPRLSWQAACAFIEDHLHLSLSREDVAAALNIHPNHLSRLFKRFGESSFNGYITRKRMNRARVMLADSRWNITDVSLQCGFTSLSYFARVCRIELGQAPSEFRQAAVLAASRRKHDQPV